MLLWALLRKAQTTARSYFFVFLTFIQAKIDSVSSNKKVVTADDFSILVAGEPQISKFLEGYEMVVDLWKYLNRRDE